MSNFERWDLPVSFFPVIMLSLPSIDEASTVKSEESLVVPRVIGSLPLILRV
jgi:hypothetical protein